MCPQLTILFLVWFKPNSESISFLAEICLSLAILIYVLRLQNKTRDTRLYIGFVILNLLWSIVGFFYNSNIYATTESAYLTEWTLAFLLSAYTLYRLWFAYKFGNNPFRREFPYVMLISISLCGFWLFIWLSVYTPAIYLSPSRFLFGAIVFTVIAFYASIIFLRKIIFTDHSYKSKTFLFYKFNSWKENLGVLSKALKHPITREIKAYRGFFMWAIIYFIVFILQILTRLEFVNVYFWAFSSHILLLVNIVQSVFVLLNYAKEKSSFQAKLVWVVLCVVLIILGLLPYMLYGTGYPSASDPHPETNLKVFLFLIPSATIVIVIILPLIFRHNILRSLGKIMDGVKAVSEGNLSSDVKIEVNDEVGDLSKNFNLMTESLREYSNKMEYLVAERTKQLQTSLNDLKSTQAQLIQSEKMASLGELTAGIAHEIQNPLNFVNNFSDVNAELIDEAKEEMEKGNFSDAKTILNDIKDNEQKINHHGKRADAIVKGMLQHSRSSTGQREMTDINALCDEYLRLAYHGLRAKDKSFNAKFETDFDSSIGKINVVPQEIGRVILNLINNAFYAVTERKKNNEAGYEPTVVVSTRKMGDKVEIRVKDNGKGISEKILDKIFQPFFTTKPTGQGTGLGLSLSYDIITKGHGAELKVETNEGEGSEFIIRL